MKTITTSENIDPCLVFLDLYLSCVGQYKHGLKQDEECKPEADQYKKCRAEQKQIAALASSESKNKKQ